MIWSIKCTAESSFRKKFIYLYLAFRIFRYRGAPGRRVGPALDTATKLFATAPNKAGKKITIVVLTARPQDNPAVPAAGLKKIGVTIYSIGIIPFVKPADLKPIPGPDYVTKWKNLPNVITKIRIPISRGKFWRWPSYKSNLLYFTTLTPAVSSYY